MFNKLLNVVYCWNFVMVNMFFFFGPLNFFPVFVIIHPPFEIEVHTLEFD